MKRRNESEKEITRDDFTRPADIVLSMRKKNALRLAEEFRKVKADRGLKNE